MKASALRKWLHDNCTYSLHPSTSEGADPNAQFLFGDHRGFCVHAAQSMTLMLRALGVSARLAGGFMLPAERRGNGSGMLLSGNDRHCWCEVYLDGAGWIPFDVSMESEEPDPPQVDAAVQRYFNERNRQANDPIAETPRNLGKRASLLMLLAIILVMASLYGVKAWRRYLHHWSHDRRLPRLCYRAVLDRLSDVGLYRQFGESREDFARRVAGLIPEFVPLSDAHVRQWLSHRPILPRSSWLELESRCRTRLTLAIPRSRRLRGWLNPIGWLWSQ